MLISTTDQSTATTQNTVVQDQEHWSSLFTFLIASVGFVVGLGNTWKFPYVTGENGGGVFILIYLLCALGIGVPILMAEILIGSRSGKQSSNITWPISYSTDSHRSLKVLHVT